MAEPLDDDWIRTVNRLRATLDRERKRREAAEAVFGQGRTAIDIRALSAWRALVEQSEQTSA